MSTASRAHFISTWNSATKDRAGAVCPVRAELSSTTDYVIKQASQFSATANGARAGLSASNGRRIFRAPRPPILGESDQSGLLLPTPPEWTRFCEHLYLHQGGFMMYPLILCSILAIGIILERAYTRSARRLPLTRKNCWRRSRKPTKPGDHGAAAARLMEDAKTPYSRIFARGLKNADRSAGSD